MPRSARNREPSADPLVRSRNREPAVGGLFPGRGRRPGPAGGNSRASQPHDPSPSIGSIPRPVDRRPPGFLGLPACGDCLPSPRHGAKRFPLVRRARHGFGSDAVLCAHDRDHADCSQHAPLRLRASAAGLPARAKIRADTLCSCTRLGCTAAGRGLWGPLFAREPPARGFLISPAPALPVPAGRTARITRDCRNGREPRRPRFARFC